MSFEKVEGKSNRGGRREGSGRKPGVPNKLSGDLKSMILDALGNAGGVAYLQDVAQNDRKAFCALLGRVLPMTVQGDPENPLEVNLTNDAATFASRIAGLASRADKEAGIGEPN